MTLFNAISENAPKLLKAGITVLETLMDGIAQNIGSITETIVQLVVKIAEILTNPESLSSLLDAALQIITGLAQGLLEALPTLIAALPTIISNIVDFFNRSIPMIIEAGITLLTALVDNLPEIITGIVVAIPKIIMGIVDAVIGNIDKIIVAGVELFVALIAATPQIILGIVEAIPQIITGIADAFKEQKGIMSNIGTNLISGIGEGIKNAASGLWDNLQNAVGSAVDKVKEFLGIHSPSTVFAGIGENMALGLGVGWDDEFSDVQKDINNGLDFSADTSMSIKRVVSTDYNSNAFQGGYTTQKATGLSAAKQPLVVVVQLANGIELARTLIDDINNANRVDGKPKSVAY